MSAVAWDWVSFAVLRFLVGVAIGSEWATGASIVSELWPDHARGKGGGLLFPGGLPEPDYWDFVYFSFVVGMTSQVSDVAITCRPIRHTVSAHGIISFIFNVALLALTVNIAASAI